MARVRGKWLLAIKYSTPASTSAAELQPGSPKQRLRGDDIQKPLGFLHVRHFTSKWSYLTSTWESWHLYMCQVLVTGWGSGAEWQAGCNMINKQKKHSLMRQNSLQKTRSKRGRQRIQVQGRQGQTDRTTGKRHGTIDDNPTGDTGKTDTIYRRETQVYDIRQ